MFVRRILHSETVGLRQIRSANDIHVIYCLLFHQYGLGRSEFHADPIDRKISVCKRLKHAKPLNVDH